jgi:hypothetical protein
VLGALTLPDNRLAWIEKKYARIRAGLPKQNGEVQGRNLDEAHVAAVIELLRRNGALLEPVAVDVNLHEPNDVNAHRQGQAEGMTSGLTDAHHENIRRFANDVANRIRALNDQLYLQSVAMFDLVWQTCEHSITCYAQRQPKELAAFYWTIDAKDKGRTTSGERLWADIVMQVLQTRVMLRQRPLR